MAQPLPERFASKTLDFQVDRDDFRKTRFVAGPPAEAVASALEDGQVMFGIDRFALTSNNISYAAAGDLLKYWDFFPGEERWGRIPAMGFGDVVASRHPEVAVGTRCFGFFPMSRHLVVQAESSRSGLVDRAEHRAQHAPVYRSYTYTGPDPLYEETFEDHILLLRGLFMTSFLVDDFLADADFYGTSSTLVTSASSKTSIALAHLLKARGSGAVIGLTSARNRAFVESLGCYDAVVLYDELDRLEAMAGEGGAVMVDMAGNGAVVEGVHQRLGDALKYSCTVGATHWESAPRPKTLPGPEPEFFFAPARIVKRTQDWGAEGLQERIGSAWKTFARWSNEWMAVRRHHGPEALERVYREVLAGDLDPRDGHVISLC